MSRRSDVPIAGLPNVAAWLPFVVAGAVLVLAGGMVAAAGGEAPSRHLSWASAYLVLVCGATQIFLGGGQAMLVRQPARRLVLAQLVTFELGNACVLVGTLSGVHGVLYAGSATLFVSLAMFAWSTRAATLRPRLFVIAYRALVVLLAVGVPAGSVLAR
ncbi:MAG: hypothetical protein ACRDXC_12840 [Acidimicrobiales bacterium]